MYMNCQSSKHDEWEEEKERRRESYKNVRSQGTRDGENSTGNSGSEKSLTLSSHIQFALCTDCGLSHSDIT